MNKKEIAIALMKTIETKSTETLEWIDMERFIHHTVRKEDGFQGIWNFLLAAPGASTVNPVRVIQDGDYVFLHTDFDFYGPHIGFDVFRFEHGKIVEMWDCIQAKAEIPGSGYTMIGGSTAIQDLDQTENNKQLAANYVTEVLIGGNAASIGQYYAEQGFTEHNRYHAAPVPSLTQALAGDLHYHTLHKVLGEGNFVLTISEGELAGQHSACFDLFRLEAGKIAEHWDVIEPIAPKDQWKNTTGRF